MGEGRKERAGSVGMNGRKREREDDGVEGRESDRHGEVSKRRGGRTKKTEAEK